MTRARRDSIVSSIASHGRGTEYQTVPHLLDDSYLFNQLEKLSITIADDQETSKKPLESPSSGKAPSSAVGTVDRYEKYVVYLQQLDRNIQQYDTIMAQSKRVNAELTQSIEKFNSISSNTTKFVNKTRNLYEETTELTKLYEGISPVLQYFDTLEPIIRRLNHSSSANLVRKNSFKTMLSNLDSSLIFLDSHLDFRDSEKYRIKFKRCLIRACELIAHYLKNLLTQIFFEINEKLSGRSATVSKVSTGPLLYNKFAMSAEDYYAQVIEITSRANNDKFARYHDEINSILNGCYDQYFQIRSKLLQPVTSTLIKEITNNEKEYNLVEFIQEGKSYYQQLCIDEYNLFIKFFPKEQSHQRINQWLCQLCEPLYDGVRTQILRETEISTLCDSVTLFSQYYEFEENSEEYSKQFHDIKFDKVFEPIVQKLQARLILRVQIYIQENIVKYTPTKDSFIISRRKKTGEKLETREEDHSDPEKDLTRPSIVHVWDNDAGSYYPTLIKSLWLLSKIYEMVNSVIFDDLAHHIVHDCLLSLRKAYDMVQSSSSGVNNLDIKLAYLKNLLMLRQEIQNFNIQYTVNETYLDFSGVEAFFKSTSDGSRGQSATSIFSVAKSLVPKVVNSMVDARTELMAELRNLIKDFTDCVAKSITEDTLKVDNLHDQDLLKKNLELRNNIEEHLPHIHAQICNFIEDSEIVIHLLDAIQETIIRSYDAFYENVSEKAENGGLDKSQVSELMYTDVFADFINKVTNKLVESIEIM